MKYLEVTFTTHPCNETVNDVVSALAETSDLRVLWNVKAVYKPTSNKPCSIKKYWMK